MSSKVLGEELSSDRLNATQSPVTSVTTALVTLPTPATVEMESRTPSPKLARASRSGGGGKDGGGGACGGGGDASSSKQPVVRISTLWAKNI